MKIDAYENISDEELGAKIRRSHQKHLEKVQANSAVWEKVELLTVEQLCQLLQIGKNSAYKLLQTGKIKSFKLGRSWKIPHNSVTDYIKQQSE